MLQYWLSLTSPEKPCETVNVNYKVNVLKGQCISIASIIFILAYFFLGIIENVLWAGIGCSLFVLLLLYFVNRKGYVKTVAVAIILLTQIVGFYLLVVNKETTGITVLLLSTIVCVIALRPFAVIIFIVSMIIIMMLYMFQMHQLFSNLMWTRLVTHGSFGVIEYVTCFAVNKILLQANDLQTLVNTQRTLEAKNIILEKEKESIIRSLMLIRAAISDFENGKTTVRIPAHVDVNTLKDMSHIINILLSKQEKLLKTKKEFHAIENHIASLAQVLQLSQTFHTTIEYGFTRTRLDLLIQLLKGKKFTQSELPDDRESTISKYDI